MKLLNTKKNSFEKSFNLILNSKRSQAKDNIRIVQKIINNVRLIGFLKKIKGSPKEIIRDILNCSSNIFFKKKII